MKIHLNSIYVDDQEKALRFYTEVLGFVKKQDIKIGDYRWLTVVSPEELNGTELVLEPADNPAVITFKKALYEQGIPVTAFRVENLEKDIMNLKSKHVAIIKEPVQMEHVVISIFDDSCGNLIQLYQRG